MTVRMRHTKSHTANRRSHHALKKQRLSLCADCKSSYRRHSVCLSCGRYRGRIVIDVAAELEKKLEKAKAKAKTRREEGKEEAKQAEEKPLNAEELSKK